MPDLLTSVLTWWLHPHTHTLCKSKRSVLTDVKCVTGNPRDAKMLGDVYLCLISYVHEFDHFQL